VLKRGGKSLIKEVLEAMSAVSRLKSRAERRGGEGGGGGVDSRRSVGGCWEGVRFGA
jgi:hypothetical protein